MCKKPLENRRKDTKFCLFYCKQRYWDLKHRIKGVRPLRAIGLTVSDRLQKSDNGGGDSDD